MLKKFPQIQLKSSYVMETFTVELPQLFHFRMMLMQETTLVLTPMVLSQLTTIILKRWKEL